jgi:hypothetical protein
MRINIFGAWLVLALVPALSACGRFGVPPREAWRGDAERQCLRSGQVKTSAYLTERPAIHDSYSCGMDRPLLLTAFANGRIGLAREMTLGCPMVAATEAWLAEIVQPAAERFYGSTVIRMRTGGYSCRGRNGASNGPLSEHAFGNALDVFSFSFADGREVTIARGWRGEAHEQNFLRAVFVGACGRFSTVLGPGSDAQHADHFHLDLARRQSRGGEAHCRPIIKFDPVAADAVANALPPAPLPAQPKPWGLFGRWSPF